MDTALLCVEEFFICGSGKEGENIQMFTTIFPHDIFIENVLDL